MSEHVKKGGGGGGEWSLHRTITVSSCRIGLLDQSVYLRVGQQAPIQIYIMLPQDALQV